MKITFYTNYFQNDRSTHDYNLRPRSHDRSLNVRTDDKLIKEIL